MASTIVNIQLPTGKSGLTITLYPDGSDTAGNTPDTLTEETNRLGLYSATVTEALAGVYYAKVLDGATLLGSGWVTLADDTSTYQVVDSYSEAAYLNVAVSTAPTAAANADAVWDEAASGHNAAGSFGKFVRQLKEGVISIEADVNDVSATTTSFVTTLTEASDSHYSDLSVAFISGALTGQSRVATAYNGTTKTLTFDEAWSEAPADGDTFIILTPHIHTVSQLADGVWDEAIAGHLTAGTTGASLDTAASTGLTTQQIADAVHSLAPTGSPAAGSLGDDTDNLLARITASATTAAAAANGDISTPIIRGDAYNTAAGNAFTVSSAGFPAAVWDAVVTGTLKLLQGTTYSTVGTVAVTHDSSETITATISFTSAETSGLVKDPGTTYELELTVGSDQRTLTGNWAVTGSDE